MTVLGLHDIQLNDLLAKPFHKDGTGPDFWNCWNLCREIHKRAGKFLPLYSEWIEDLSVRNSLIQRLRREFLPLSEPEFLAIVALKMVPKYPDYISHIGVMIDNRHFINVREKVGVAIEDVHSRRWEKRIEGFYRYG